MEEISRRNVLKAGGLAAAAAAAGALSGVARPQRAQAAAGAAGTVTVNSRWVGPVFNAIDVNLAGYTGRSFTTSSNGSYAHHSDFPGGGSPQTQQVLPCHWEPITDYFQTPAPWPPVMGIMNNVNTTGPGVTGLTGNLAALYLGTGVGMSSNFDSHGLPMNYEAMTSPSSLASLPVPAGTWSGTPTMADGSAAKPVIPVIGWNLGGTSLIDIANGVHDTDTIIPAAKACKLWAADANGNPAYPGQPGGQVFIRLMHEFNGPWAPYCPGSSSQPSTCTAATFVSAWKHIVGVFAAQGATNARWVWAPNICASGAANGTHSGWTVTSGTTKLCYPGDAYVDYVGLDGYNKSVPNWTKFQNLFSPSYGWMYNGDAFITAITTTKPMIITEFSSLEDDNFTSPPQTKAQFITDITTVVPASFPNVEGVMLWHENVGDSLEWPMTSSTAAMNAWNTLARNAGFQGKPDLIQGVTSALAGGGTGPGTPYVAVDYTSGTGTGSSYTVPVNKKALTAGDGFCLAIETSNPGITITQVTDTKGNLYTVDNASHAEKPVAFAYVVAPTALTTSDTITVKTSSTNTNLRAIGVGLPGITAKDLSPAGNGGTGSSFSAATGTLGHQNEVCLGVAGYSGTTVASGLSWTLVENEGGSPELTLAYKLPGATTASQTFSGTLPSGTLFDVGVITFN